MFIKIIYFTKRLFLLIILFKRTQLLEIASCSQNALTIWNELNPNKIDSLSCIVSIFYNSYLLSGYKNGEIKVWDMSNFSLLNDFMNHNDGINSIEQIDNQTFVTGSEYKISFWSFTNKSLNVAKDLTDRLLFFKVLQNRSLLVCLFRKDKMILSFRYWDKSLIKIFNTTSFEFEAIEIEEDGKIRCIEILDDSMIAYCYKNYIKIFNFINNFYVDSIDAKGHLSSIKYLNNNIFACGFYNGRVELWDKESKSRKKRVDRFRNSFYGIYLEKLGNLIGYSNKRFIYIWNLETEKKIAYLRHDSFVVSFLFINDTLNFESTESIPEPFEEETLPLNDLPIETINLILSSDIDIGDCLSNCSNRGHCVLLEQEEPEKFSCSCDADFGGNKCQIDLRPCSSNPCLNNGKCKEVLNDTTSKTIRIYECECAKYYFGKNCQFQINVCQNETCSSHGVCQSLNFKPKCKCFPLYEGEQCEIEKPEKKVIDRIVKTSTIIAIIFLIFFILILVIIDLSGIFMKKKDKKKVSQIRKSKLIDHNFKFQFFSSNFKSFLVSLGTIKHIS